VSAALVLPPTTDHPDRGWFELPPGRSATGPPGSRGLARDGVRLVVATPDRVRHTRFRSLAHHLAPGDLVVVNTSATLPAALDAQRPDGRSAVVHAAGPHPAEDGSWIVEIRLPDASGPSPDARAGEVLHVAGGARLHLREAHPDPAPRTGSRLWRAELLVDGTVEDHLHRHGHPVSYGYLRGRYPLRAYQTIFARHPGSAEMASAGRPFTTELVTELASRGIALAPITLHTGVSSPDAGEPPEPERFHVPDATARLVAATRRGGGRIVAVGTTVTRALETVAAGDGSVRGGSGWTDLVLGPDRPARVVGGLITGWHAPEASHLELLEAVAGRALVRQAYAAALAGDVLWHEFGDSALLLP
jgi:S-adenosylmethionine:tRNA ribosyltransferase-isomerase